jgi:hypothetical protein
MGMPKEKLPLTPPNTEPHPMRDEEDLHGDLDEDAPQEKTEDEEADSGLGPRG